MLKKSAIILIFLLAACKTDRQYKFIEDLLGHPHEIEQVMAHYAMMTGDYREKNFGNDSKKKQLLEYLEKYISLYYSKDYTIKCDRKYVGVMPEKQSKVYYHELFISGSNPELLLKAQWIYDLGIWKLYELQFINQRECPADTTSP